MIQPGEFCRVTNENTKPFKGKYERQVYVIDPGQTVTVPFSAAILWFGDPRSIDTVQLLRNEYGKVTNMLPSRPDEIKRLRFKHGGNLTGDESTFEETDDNGRTFLMPHLPVVSVRTLDGDVITMVVSDPEGNNPLGAEPKPASNQSAELLEIVRKQERQINLLIKQLEINTGYEDTDVEPNDLIATTDIPLYEPNEDELPTDDIPDARAKFKVYNTDTGVPGPDIKELV